MTQAATDNYALDTEFATRDLATAGTAGGARGNTTQFKPKPYKDKQVYTNKLFVSLVRPKYMPGFENYPSEHKLFYVKLFGHYIPSQTDAKKTDFVLCKVQHNKYAKSIANNPNAPLFFEDDRCASCEEAQAVWDQYTARWAELGYPDKDSRKGLSKEAYKELAADPQLDALKKSAMIHQFKERYALPVYNLEQQPLTTGFQWFFGAESVYKGLMALVAAGVRFYSLNAHAAVDGAVEGAEIMVTKDTTNGVRQCEYSVADNRGALGLAVEEIEYLKDEANIPPLLDLVAVWDYDTHKQIVVAGVAMDENGDYTPESVAAAAIRAARPAPVAAVRTAPVSRTISPATAAARPVAAMASARPAPSPAVRRPGVAAAVPAARTLAAAAPPIQAAPPIAEQPEASAPEAVAASEQVAPPVVARPTAAATRPTAPARPAATAAPAAAPTTAPAAAPRPRRTW